MKRFNSIKKTAIITALLLGGSAEAQTVTGTGTANYVPMFTGTSTIGNSLLRQGTGNDANRVYSGGPLTITDANTATSPAMLYVGYSSSMLIGIGSSTPTLTNSASIMSVQSTVTGLQFSSNGAAPINGTYPVGRLTTVTTTTDLFKITNAGLTGIGLASPATQLDVQAIGTNDPFQVRNNAGATLVKVLANGNVGIGTGTLSPAALLHIQDVLTTKPLFLVTGYDGYTAMKVSSDGYLVQIGNKIPTGNYAYPALSVDGNIVAKKIIVQTGNWADYVFAKDYKLLSLTEVESYIKENGHLPEIPSECEVLEKGIDTGEMNRLLLQKVEELTLHIIEQSKRMQDLEETIANLKK